MKKVLSILLAAVLLLSLAGCGGTEPDSSVPAVTTTAVAKSTTAAKTTKTTTSTTAATTSTTAAKGTTTAVATTTTTAAATTTTTAAAPATTTKAPPKEWKMKNILILGDSISTFEGHIPSYYATYYSAATAPNDVRKVDDTWWYSFAKEYNLNICKNDSWSGSPIGYTGYGGADVSTHHSFLFRLEVLVEDGFFEENDIDTVFVFGGTNDSWADAPIGKLKYAGFKQNDLYEVLPACSYLMKRLKEVVPNGKIVWIINYGLKSEIAQGMVTAAKKYKITYLQLPDYDRIDAHPSVKGMKQIKDLLVAELDKSLPNWK